MPSLLTFELCDIDLHQRENGSKDVRFRVFLRIRTCTSLGSSSRIVLRAKDHRVEGVCPYSRVSLFANLYSLQMGSCTTYQPADLSKKKMLSVGSIGRCQLSRKRYGFDRCVALRLEGSHQRGFKGAYQRSGVNLLRFLRLVMFEDDHLTC